MAELVNRDRALGVDLEIARIENILLMRKVLFVRFTVKFLTVFFLSTVPATENNLA